MVMPANRLNFAKKMMRSPGFEPGSSAWQADVLAKLDYDRFLLDYAPVALLIVFEVYFFFPKVMLLCDLWCGFVLYVVV
jgi:hypothetical protein